MKKTNEYLIPFIGLKIGKHHFEYEIEKKFFDVFAFDEFENCTIHIAVVLEKKTTIMELSFAHKGTVVVPCDLTGEMFDLPIKGKIKLAGSAVAHIGFGFILLGALAFSFWYILLIIGAAVLVAAIVLLILGVV